MATPLPRIEIEWKDTTEKKHPKLRAEITEAVNMAFSAVRAALQSATAVTANFGKDWSKNAAPKHAALFKQFFGKTDPMEDNYTANQVLRLMDEAFHGKLTFVVNKKNLVSKVISVKGLDGDTKGKIEIWGDFVDAPLDGPNECRFGIIIREMALNVAPDYVKELGTARSLKEVHETAAKHPDAARALGVTYQYYCEQGVHSDVFPFMVRTQSSTGYKMGSPDKLAKVGVAIPNAACAPNVIQGNSPPKRSNAHVWSSMKVVKAGSGWLAENGRSRWVSVPASPGKKDAATFDGKRADCRLVVMKFNVSKWHDISTVPVHLRLATTDGAEVCFLTEDRKPNGEPVYKSIKTLPKGNQGKWTNISMTKKMGLKTGLNTLHIFINRNEKPGAMRLEVEYTD